VPHRSIAVALLLTLACSAPRWAQVDGALLSDESDGDHWPSRGRTFLSQHYSPLDEIRSDNVARLGLVASLDFPDVWHVSSQPLEMDGVLYLAIGYSVVHAVDAVSGELLWRYDPEVRGPKMALAWGIRGLALWKGRVFVGTQDGRLVALDARTGRLEWQVQTTEPEDRRYITGPPLVFDDTVLIGHGGADFGLVRGYVTAYDTQSGRQRWRFHTVPGDPAEGFENEAMEMAAKTWTGEWWKYGGGGTVWHAMTYDPDRGRVYLGTGNGAPWNQKIRSPGGGDNLFLSSIVALDAKTGRYVWHYQTTPGETWDYNSAMDIELATLEIDGRPRPVILHAPKNGFFYVIDREDGQLVSAAKFAKVTWAQRIDPETGRPVEAAGSRYEDGEELLWPGSLGAHGWPPMSFNPRTGLVYIPARDIPALYRDRTIDPARWTPEQTGNVLGLDPDMSDTPEDAGRSFLLAWDPVRQRQAWRADTPALTAGGTLTTAGDLVFQPQADGKFVARDARDGSVRWSYAMGVGSQAPPISYRVGGRQYVALLAGWAGQPMLLGTASAAMGWVGREHPRRLLIFALDGRASLPPAPPRARPVPLDDPAMELDPQRVRAGELLFFRCGLCHGMGAISGGAAPDLRASPIALSAEAFDSAVRGGSLLARGMPEFPDLTPEEVESLRHYVRARARATLGASPTPR
jgi:quinohemoprotein ethanol dehydrogenase